MARADHAASLRQAQTAWQAYKAIPAVELSLSEGEVKFEKARGVLARLSDES